MNKVKLRFIAILLFISTGGLFAQKTILASGEDLSGIGGSNAYSLGQVFYNTNSGVNGSASQGVQQPYEISVVLGVDETDIALELYVFPNPVSNYLNLVIGDINRYAFSYQLLDMNERIIQSRKLTSNSTIIDMERFSAAVYFLNIKDGQRIIKIFKIIKD